MRVLSVLYLHLYDALIALIKAFQVLGFKNVIFFKKSRMFLLLFLLITQTEYVLPI